VRGFYNPPGFLSQTRNIKKRLIFIVAEKFMQFNMSKITSQKCRLCHCLKRSLDWHCQTRQKVQSQFSGFELFFDLFASLGEADFFLQNHEPGLRTHGGAVQHACGGQEVGHGNWVCA
jgi:hypothetical protein